MNAPICMEEEVWRNSQLSIARYYGGIKFDNHEYVIVNKGGKDLFQCTIEAEKEGRDKAIPAGEPADLLRKDFLKFYRKLGRDAFIEVLKKNQRADDKELTLIYKELTKKKEYEL